MASPEEFYQTESEKAAVEERMRKSMPECDFGDPAQLEAWYGNFGFFEHYRKVVVANCREIERAKAAIDGAKLTVDRVDDLARVSGVYFNFLTIHLNGRILREQNVLASYGR